MLGIEIAVIRYIVLDRFFNDRVPGALDLNRGHRNEIRLDPTVRIGVLSKRRKRIKDADAVGRIQKILTERLALKNEFFVELFFQGFGSFLGADRFIFKSFELRRDVALNVFQRLAAAVIGRYFVDLTFWYLNEVTLNAVEFHSKIRNARPFFFTGFVVN